MTAEDPSTTMNRSDVPNLIVKTTSLVMHIVKDYVSQGDFVVDCTMGNGHDTLSLARLTGADGVSENGGKVLAFDVQEEALDATRKLLKENGIKDLRTAGIRLVKDSHENLQSYLAKVQESPSAIIFNLGFLPGQDKSIVTSKSSTMKAVKTALDMIAENGIVAVTTYAGHPEGAEEQQVLYDYLKSLPSKKFHVAYINMINQKRTAPSVFLITKKKK